ncbi:type I-E CRISPR-associated protein Cse2/CasB [Vibrio parahaemolyticus]|nr:type I-E CRISPR-associated protein Cse2/CasB [Vibrio parahaemolyticus]
MLNTTEGRILMRWWQSLMLSESELQKIDENLRPAPSGYKSRLKRAESIDAAMMQDAFRLLWLKLPEPSVANADDMERWAVIATTLMFVSPGHQDSLAKAAGKKRESSDKSVVSEARFARLQAARTPDELLRILRRLLQLVKGKTDPLALANNIEQWFNEYQAPRPRQAKHRIIIQWAMDYHRAAK